MFRCNLPPALLAGSFMCHCSKAGGERTPNKNQHTKLTLGKKSPAAPAWTRTRNLSITSPALYQQVILAPTLVMMIIMTTTVMMVVMMVMIVSVGIILMTLNITMMILILMMTMNITRIMIMI